MASPVVKLIFKKKYAADTHGYIRIKVTLPGGHVIEKSLKHRIPQSGWDKKSQHVKPSAHSREVDPAQINAEILSVKAELINDLQQRTLSAKAITPTVIKAAIRHNKPSANVLDFMDGVILDMKAVRKTKDGLKPKYATGYTKMLDTLRNKVESYDPDVAFADITAQWMEAFEKHLAKTLNGDTSLPKTLSRFNTFLEKAAKRGLFSIDQIDGYKLPEYTNPERPYLTLEETDQFADLLYQGKVTGEVRNIVAFFLVECYAGIRFSDWSRFSIEKLVHNDALLVRETKKTGQPVYLPLHKSPRLARVVAYIKDNGLTFTLTEQYTNRVLGAIALDLEIGKKVTTHVGRHTAATLFLELGYSKEATAQVLGVSLATVDVYAKVTRRKISAEYEKLGGL